MDRKMLTMFIEGVENKTRLHQDVVSEQQNQEKEIKLLGEVAEFSIYIRHLLSGAIISK